MSVVERERGMEVLAISAQPTMNAIRTRSACVMWMGRLARSAKAWKASMICMAGSDWVVCLAFWRWADW